MRSMRWTLMTGLLAALHLGTAAAQDKDKSLALTVYNKDLALVEHVRPVNLPAGRHRIEFKAVVLRIGDLAWRIALDPRAPDRLNPFY